MKSSTHPTQQIRPAVCTWPSSVSLWPGPLKLATPMWMIPDWTFVGRTHSRGGGQGSMLQGVEDAGSH